MIEIEQLREWLPSRRWFGGKDRSIKAVDIFDQAVVYEEEQTLVLSLVDVTYSKGAKERYFAPVMIDGEGKMWDPFDDPGYLAIFGELMAHGESVKGESGVFH